MEIQENHKYHEKKRIKNSDHIETTTQAIGMESACKKHQIAGRLIPVPKEITAGCGMAWMTPLENEESVVQFMSEHEIIPQGGISGRNLNWRLSMKQIDERGNACPIPVVHTKKALESMDGETN